MGDFVRPADTDRASMTDAVAWQRDYVKGAGSPVAATILEAVHEDLITDGQLVELLPSEVRFGDLVGLRIMAAVHRLAITRVAPLVALHLPTLGGTPPTAADERTFADAVVAALLSNPGVLQSSIAQTPQTNEVGRSALLRCALSQLGTKNPVRLREIGCSAGLNLRADHLPGVPEIEAGPLPVIADRLGCDLSPVDPTTTEGRVHLTSYVWVDDLPRYERLRTALEVAALVPARVIQQDAAALVESMDLADGTTTVLWHSAMWPYLVDEQRRRVLDGIARLGSEATSNRSFAHVSWEWMSEPVDPRSSFELVVRRWRGEPSDGRPYVLARGGGHGNEPALVPGSPVELAEEPLPS
jgi:hypothetical protein